MMPLVNIHTHYSVDNKEFIEIQNIDIDNATDVGVFRFCSIGFHPWNVKSQQSTNISQQIFSTLSRILKVSDSQSIMAIGECGLDRACNCDFDLQKNIFIKQIQLSEQYAKPLIIHAVKSYPDIIAIRKVTKAKQNWIIHGFQGNEQSAMQLLKHEGFYLSLGDVLFKNEYKARQLLRVIPVERLFFETDVADRNIKDVYEKASQLSGLEMDELTNDIFNNFVKIFGKI